MESSVTHCLMRVTVCQNISVEVTMYDFIDNLTESMIPNYSPKCNVH